MEGMDTSENEQEALVEAVEADSENISGLSHKDIERLAQLSHDLQLPNHSDDVELVEEEEEVIINEPEQMVVQSELAHEIEVETEEPPEDTSVKVALPPLRPLTIAPKPTKVPVSFTTKPGQYIVVQGSGQPMKLVAAQAQGLNMANLTLAKPVSLRTIGKPHVSGSVSVLQPKQVLIRKLATPTKDAKPHGNLIKLETTALKAQGTIALGTPTKTLTLSRVQPLTALSSKQQAFVLNKLANKAIKVQVPSSLAQQAKLPAKILPAPQQAGGTKLPAQRLLVRDASGTHAVQLPAGQLIEVGNAQQLAAAGQLHQINGVQYIKLVNSSSGISLATKTIPTTTTTNASPQTVNILNKMPILSAISNAGIAKSTNVVLAEKVGAAPTIAPKPLKPVFRSQGAVSIANSSSSQIVVITPGYAPQIATAKVPIPQVKPPQTLKPPAPAPDPAPSGTESNMESNGIRPRKPCNCTKSQCLKLYCDCFACGEFCYLCNCVNCYNNLDNEEYRQKAIKSCLERNPHAFRPKIGKAKDAISGDQPVRKHTKGCNCKRSGCLKNYCECYEAKIACSAKCKCLGCRNVTDVGDKKSSFVSRVEVPVPTSPPIITSRFSAPRNALLRSKKYTNNKHAFSLITEDVIEATSQCLLAISDSAQTNGQAEELTKQQIIEEFGRCLQEIIKCSTNHN